MLLYAVSCGGMSILFFILGDILCLFFCSWWANHRGTSGFGKEMLASQILLPPSNKQPRRQVPSRAVSDLVLPLPVTSFQPLSLLRKDNHNQNYRRTQKEVNLKITMNSWMDEWRKASSFSSTAELSVSPNKLESESCGPYEAKRRLVHQKSPLTTNPGELDANLTMLLLLSEEDFLGKKDNKHRNILGQMLVSRVT